MFWPSWGGECLSVRHAWCDKRGSMYVTNNISPISMKHQGLGSLAGMQSAMPAMATLSPLHKVHRVGLVGTGFIASGFARLLARKGGDLVLSSVLSRRTPAAAAGLAYEEHLTTSADELLDSSDVIIECSGDVLHATEVISRAVLAGKPVITMNSEFHVTTGSYFVGKGLVTEAEGDQPGCLAALREEADAMGFTPLVYGNMKGFLNHHPDPEEMKYWSGKQGISLAQTTSFTDGTKIQIEQAFVANAFGATVTRQGLEGPEAGDLNTTAFSLAQKAMAIGSPIADYVLAPGKVAGVFVVCTHEDADQSALRYLKMGDGPYYLLLKNYHLCQYEILKTVRRVLSGGGALLTNSAQPTISVVGIAKHDMPAGTHISRAIGSFQIRGEAAKIQDVRGHVPIGLLQDAVTRRKVIAGQVIGFDDVDLPDSLAQSIARTIFV